MAGLTAAQFKKMFPQANNEPITGALATGLNAIRGVLDPYKIPESVPLLGGQSAADLTGFTGAAGVVEDFSRGKLQSGDMRMFDLLGVGAGVAPAARAAVKGGGLLGREALEQMNNNRGLLSKISVDPRQYMYKPTTPSKPDLSVGKRYVSKEQGNLVPQKEIPIEQLKDGSIAITPYDNTVADTSISSISDDIILDNPVYTMGGDNFSRIMRNYENNIGGASNYGMASKVNGRYDVGRLENLAQQGDGRMFSATANMGENSEAFSSYPTDIVTQIFNQNGNPKSFTQFNDWLRKSTVTVRKDGQNVTVRPFGSFKGVETKEGLEQLYTGDGFGAGGTAGNLRKNLFKGASQKKFEKMFDYNMADVKGAVNDAKFADLPKGFARGNVIAIPENTALTQSSNGSGIRAYDTDTAGQYYGTLKTTPLEVLMPKTYNRIFEELRKKNPSRTLAETRQSTLAAMEKRGDNISEFVDQEVIDKYYQYHEGLLGK
tara:strand:- start:383 stop:1849 length:1467 start_codon:yes stop_codon:yes gene_type:complete